MSNTGSQLRDLSHSQRERLLVKLRDLRPSDQQITESDFPRRMATSGVLSFAQQRMWFLHEMYPGATAYNCPLTIRINLAVDANVMERALNEVARRHEILRTIFPLRDEQPIQSVEPHYELVLHTIDLRGLPEEEREGAVTSLIRKEFARPFSLIDGPCWRSSLFQLDTDNFILLVVFHHIVFDGSSIPVFLKEVKTIYEAFVDRQSAALPELPIQYLDFTLGQRERLMRPALLSQLDYWKKQLADAPRLLILPTDRQRPAIQSFRGANQLFMLPDSLTEKIKEVARDEGSTLFMILLAAFKTLLYRYSGQDDILVGTPIANRDHWEIENLTGLFLNTLVLRSKVLGDMRFSELLRSVRETCLDAYANQEMPFEKLVEDLRPERDPRHTPIFQVMFVLQNAPQWTRPESSWSLMGTAMQAGSSQFDLTLNMEDRGSALVGAIEYNTDIFEGATITRIIENFQSLLEAIVQNPAEKLGYLSLNHAQRRQLLNEWNDTGADYPRNMSLPELFLSQVRRSPQSPAVAAGETVLNYEELNRRANQLAHRLRRAGVGPESIVAVYMQRSVSMVIALLGILKSGAAYLPLDPAHANGRLNFMLNDSAAVALVTNGDSFELANDDVITLRLDDDALASEDDADPLHAPDPENLAYVLYTSGSTGKPKGVQIRHRSLINHSFATIKRYGLNSSDRVLQFAAIAFDVAAEELFPSLITGATVVLRPDELLSPTDLLKFVEEESVTVANLPSSFWHEVVVELSRAGASLSPALRLIVIGSEKASPDKLNEWHKLSMPKPRLINAYGPTEATITSTTYLFEDWHLDQATGPVPIGRPIANTQVYLLDSRLQPVPLGAPGELCISGDSLARGYLNQPHFTAEKFVPHPFATRPGGRLYRSGDLARYLPDGNLQLIGRTDHQVKLRGFRIELGEIESVLAQEPTVRDAVVLLARSRNGKDRERTNEVALKDDIEALTRQLAALERETGLMLLKEIGETSEDEASHLLSPALPSSSQMTQIRRKSPSVDVHVSIADGFITTPRSAQRNWMLERTLDEFVHDLAHLDAIATRLVHGSERPRIENQWEQGTAICDASQLVIEGQQVMQDWERPLMEKMAQIVTQTHGDVLELGFGMGISATCIQQGGVRSHTIIECNEDVAKSFYEWKRQYPQRDIRLLLGRWEDLTDQLDSYDAIFFDTYPLSEDEFNERVVSSITFAEHFFPVAAECLRPGGIFSYYTNEIDSFSRRHQQLVLKHFSSFTLSVVQPLSPPPDCNYWWADSMVAIQAVK